MRKLLLAACAFSFATLSAQTTVTYNYTGAMQTFTVPACVTTVTITCYGAQGGNAAPDPGGTGGLGGMAQGEISVTTGQVLNIFVGGQNGYNGGGQGGANGNDYFGGPQLGWAPSGGGGSDVRVGGTAIGDRVIVGGGGGGAGRNGTWPGCQVAGPAGNGGNGGGMTGGNGGYGVGTPCNCAGGGGDIGTGGSQVAGGIHGNYYGNTACLRSTWSAGQDGTLFQGGAGSVTYYNGTGGGGGGGGGYYGGGSGGNGSDTTPGGGGGGGSSYTGGVTNGTTTPGVQSGNGVVTITYSTSSSLPPAPTSFFGNNATCPGDTLTFSTNVAGAISYTWTAPQAWTLLSGQGNDTAVFIAGATSDTIFVFATNSCGDGPAGYYIASVYSAPVVIDLGADTAICGTSVLLTADPGFTYLWNDMSTAQTLLASSSGQYSVEATSINGCTGRDTVNIILNTPPVVNLGADTAFCGTSLLLDAGVASAYMWNDMSTAQQLTATASGTYFVTVTDANGCEASDSIDVTLNPFPVVTAGAAVTMVCIADDSVMLTGSPAGGVWNSSPCISNGMFVPSMCPAGTYDLVYTYTDVNSCSAMDTVTITSDLCLGTTVATAEGFTLYPNPASGSFTLTFENANAAVQIEITDAQGRVVRSRQENNVSAGAQVQVSLENVAAGTYLVNVYIGERKVVHPLIVR